MAFETFHKQRVGPSSEPTVTVQKKGVLSLNRPAFEALHRPQAVELLYDRVENLMGLRKVEPDAEHAYVVRGLGGGRTHNTWLVSGTAFMKYYGIATDVAKRRSAQLVDSVLVVDFNEEGVEVTGNRGSGSVRQTEHESSPQLPLS